MSKCTDERLGVLLHAYELKLLGKDEVERFEMHLLHCEHCFARVSQFQEYA